MLINLFGATGGLQLVTVDVTSLSSENVFDIIKEYGVELAPNQKLSYSFKSLHGINYGEFDKTTVVSNDVVTLSVTMIETKAASELDEIILEAKEAVESGIYRDLKSACRQLRGINDEVKAIIGDYTHMSNMEMIEAINEAIAFLQPEVTPVDNDVYEKLENLNERLEVLETLNQDTEEVAKLREAVVYIANHLGLALTQYPEAFKIG